MPKPLTNDPSLHTMHDHQDPSLHVPQSQTALPSQEFLSLVDCPEVGQGARGQSPGSQQSGVSASLIPGYNSAAVCPEPDTSYARAPERELAGSRWSVIGQAAEAMLHSLGQDTRDPVCSPCTLVPCTACACRLALVLCMVPAYTLQTLERSQTAGL